MVLVYVVVYELWFGCFGLNGLVPDLTPPPTMCRRVVVLVPEEEERLSEGRVS